jgi:hypothetical protein
MMIRIYQNHNKSINIFVRGDLKMDTIRYYVPGIILILIAILIVAVPEILVAFVASIIVMAGIGALFIGHKVRKSELELRHAGEGFSDEDFFGRRFVRRPVFRDWNRWF